MQEDIRVIIFGVGGVGTGIIKNLVKRNGIKVVAAIDPDPNKVGKDIGILIGSDPMGVAIVKEPKEIIGKVEADVVLNVGFPCDVKDTFEHMKWAIENKMNVIVASAETSNLWFTDSALAEEIDHYCKKWGVSYLGAGATQTEERFIIAMTEGSTDVESIEFTHHADVQAFSDESNAAEWGITLTKEQYDKGIAEGTVKSKEDLKSSVPYLANALGWEIDDVTLEKVLTEDENGKIYGFTGIVRGFEKGVCRLQLSYEMFIDPKREYFDHLVIKGVPMVDSMNNYTPDRGLAATIGAISNAIAYVIKSPAGYVNSLTAPAFGIILDDYRKHI